MKYALLSVALILALTAGLALHAAAPQKASDAKSKVFQTTDYSIRVVSVTEGLSYPYSLNFLPDGTILIAQLNGQLRTVRNGKLAPEVIKGVPEVHYVAGKGGLMDLALHPKFAQNHWIYFTYDK